MVRYIWWILFFIVISASTANSQQIKINQIDLATSIEDRQPVGTDTSFTADTGNIFCFTQVQSESDSSHITHVWYYKDEEKARIKLNVQSENWRTWSSKNILDSWTGPWRVIVEDKNGNVLATKTFMIE